MPSGEKIQPVAAAPARVLVVDDSAFMRKMLTQILAASPALEVIGTARDGQDALQKAREWRPDVITLDVEMPAMNGIAFLERLMPELPIPVVMVSSLTAEGADVTLACLQRGAVDFVLKPSGSISLDIAACGAEITEKVRAAAGAKVRLPAPMLRRVCLPARAGTGTPGDSPAGASGATALAQAARPRRSAAAKRTLPLDAETIIVAVASSTGGPAALHEVIPRLPADLNAAYLIVQHLPAGFTRSLAERLDGASALAVREAQPGDAPERGLALIAPGGSHLALDRRGRVTLHDDPPLWGVRPAADVMMRAVAARFAGRAVGVVLTGMGRDGALGAKAISAAGGCCLAQNEATCVVYGMPRAAVEAGAVAQSVGIGEMAAALARRIAARGGEMAARPKSGAEKRCVA